jgi:hypothetical protein
MLSYKPVQESMCVPLRACVLACVLACVVVGMWVDGCVCCCSMERAFNRDALSI